ncbi:MAG: flagellar hook-basal body protein [Candidatus Latescibacteria bacterium]|nr:flagellar hook-basal body protein [Candidatus Latescibacterota bacterium]
MVKGIYLSAYGMIPRINQQNAIANNLANMSTQGFKKTDIFLRELITADNALDHALGADRSQVAEDPRINYTQGTFEVTGNDFDLALNGPGFLRVRDTAGNILYTRNGRFYLDNNGFMVNNEGMYLLNDRLNLINIQGGEVIIYGNGNILVDGEDAATIGLADFAPADYVNLQAIGKQQFLKPAAVNEIRPSVATVFMQGHLEDSNVDSIKSMVDMIETFRMFELGQKSIQIQDQSLQRVVNEVGIVR